MVVVGSLNVDLVVGLARMPDPGETVFGSSLDRHPGGKGLNQAVAAARLGAPVAMVGAVGSDEGGAWLRSLVEDEGISPTTIAIESGPSGTAVIEVDDRGMNRIVVIPGANDSLTAQQVSAALKAMTDVAVVLAQHEVPIGCVEAALRVGRDRGAVTILNPAPARSVSDEILSLVDILVPNEHEAALLTGLPTDTSEQAMAAVASLVQRGPRIVVMTRGAEGAMWGSATDAGAVPAFAVRAIDTVAAGDAFCGGLAMALAEGLPIDQALVWAAAAGALATTTAGAVPSLPYRQAVAALMEGRPRVRDQAI